MMEEIQALFETNAILGFFLTLFVMRELLKLIEDVLSSVGLESKRKRKENELFMIVKKHDERFELLEKAVQELRDIRMMDTKNSIEHDEKIEKKLSELSKIVLDEKIERMRISILDFASALQNNEYRDKEQFNFIFRQFDKYEIILEENNSENGQVSASMQYIREEYNRKLRDGF